MFLPYKFISQVLHNSGGKTSKLSTNRPRGRRGNHAFAGSPAWDWWIRPAISKSDQSRPSAAPACRLSLAQSRSPRGSRMARGSFECSWCEVVQVRDCFSLIWVGVYVWCASELWYIQGTYGEVSCKSGMTLQRVRIMYVLPYVAKPRPAMKRFSSSWFTERYLPLMFLINQNFPFSCKFIGTMKIRWFG